MLIQNISVFLIITLFFGIAYYCISTVDDKPTKKQA